MKSPKKDIQTNNIESSFAALYESFSIINRICWQGSLPSCLIRISHRLSYRKVAYAQKRTDYHRIVFNSKHFRHSCDADFLLTMAHEMIHIWQYSCGRNGGHRRDFQDEQDRLFGLSFFPAVAMPGSMIPRDSPMGYVFFMHDIKELHPLAAAKKIAACRDHRKYEISYFQSVYK